MAVQDSRLLWAHLWFPFLNKKDATKLLGRGGPRPPKSWEEGVGDEEAKAALKESAAPLAYSGSWFFPLPESPLKKKKKPAREVVASKKEEK